MRPYSVIFTPRAERQLDQLYAYIAERDGEARANHFVGKIVADCRSLKTFPQRGVKRDDIRPNLRVKSYAKRVMIAFSVIVETRTVAVHGVFYGGQDFERALRETSV